MELLTGKIHGAEGPKSLQVASSTLGGGENIKEGGKTAFLFLASRVWDIGDMMRSVGLMYLPGYSHGFFFCCSNGSLTGSGWLPFLPSSLIVGFIILLNCSMSFSIKTGGVLISVDGGVVSGACCPPETFTGEEAAHLSNSLAGVSNKFSIIGKRQAVSMQDSSAHSHHLFFTSLPSPFPHSNLGGKQMHAQRERP